MLRWGGEDVATQVNEKMLPISQLLTIVSGKYRELRREARYITIWEILQSSMKRYVNFQSVSELEYTHLGCNEVDLMSEHIEFMKETLLEPIE